METPKPRRLYPSQTPEARKEANKKYRLKNPEHVKELRRAKTARWRAANPEANAAAQKRAYEKFMASATKEDIAKRREHNAKWRAVHGIEYGAAQRKKYPLRFLLTECKRRCVKKGIVFELTAENVVVPEFCPVLGIRLAWGAGTGARSPSSPSLDRINPKGPYTPDNVMVISWKANRLKSDATIAELEAIVAYMKREAS